MIMLVLASTRRLPQAVTALMFTRTGAAAGAWPAVVGRGWRSPVGGCGAAFPAAATTLFPICLALLAAAAASPCHRPAWSST